MGHLFSILLYVYKKILYLYFLAVFLYPSVNRLPVLLYRDYSVKVRGEIQVAQTADYDYISRFIRL